MENVFKYENIWSIVYFHTYVYILFYCKLKAFEIYVLCSQYI